VKTIELNHGGNWIDRLLNAWPACIHSDAVATLFTFAWDADGWYRPASKSLYYNGRLFLRITSPGGVWLHIRLRPEWRKFQCGAGWKLNGRFGLTFRLQTDESASAGAHENAPNIGQARGWERGTA